MHHLRRAFVLGLCLLFLASLTGCPSGRFRPGQTRTFDGIEFQWCPPGSFSMGSPATEVGRGNLEDLHQVTLTNGFWLAKYELTQGQWVAVMNSNPSSPVGNDLPVHFVSWDDIQQFLGLLNGVASGSTYRLPAEAEWEYACRAGTTTRFYWGDDLTESQIASSAWYYGNSEEDTHSVGYRLPNAWGLHDIIGNVGEWCQDFYGPYPLAAVTDPQGPATGTGHVIRGGSYETDPIYARSASRESLMPSSSGQAWGFRLVREAD